ncbi:alpha/beta hydrolase [soil metagenome]
MSLRNELAKIYVRRVFHKEDEFDSLKTQAELSLPSPLKSFSKRCEAVKIGETKAVWIDKANAENGVLVYLHGGAFYFGPVKEHWQYIAQISRMARMAALVIDCRMSPLHPFPEGFKDIIEAVTNLELPPNWFFIGDSSGGGMAVSAVFRLREIKARLPKKIILLSPWVDLTLQNPAIQMNKHDDPMMTVERLSSAAREYVGDHDLKNPLISPMFGELENLPPMLIQIGTADLLLWDCRKFFLKCLDAGIEIKYEEYPSAFHDFMMLGFLPEAKKALKSQVEFIKAEARA